MSPAHDVRHALRTLRRNGAFALSAVLTLALGIGANAAIFSVLDASLLQPLPYRDPGRLVMVWTAGASEGQQQQRTAYGSVEDWARQARSFEALAGFDPTSATLTGAGPADQLSLVRVSASFFPVLGVSPMLGRSFTEQEAAAREPLVVLSHDMWQRRLGSSPDVVGRLLDIDGRRSRVIGVMPPSFSFPDTGTDVWAPETLVADYEQQRGQRGVGSWMVVGRLKSDVSLQQAQSEMSRLAAALAEVHPTENAGLGVSLVPLDRQLTGERVRAGLWILFGAVGFVVLIACANVASLQLARVSARRRELAIRASLGASRARLSRQLLSESLVLSVLAGVLGLLVARLLIDGLVAFGPRGLPRLAEVQLGGEVLFYTFALSLLVGAVCGAGPAWLLTGRDPASALKEGGRGVVGARGARRAGAALIVAEVALAVTLASGAALLGRSLMRVYAVDPGFESANVLMMQLAVPRERADAERVAFCRNAVASVEGLPGVVAAGAVNDFFVPERPDQAVFVEGGLGAAGGVRRQVAPVTSEAVSGRYFEAVGLPLLGGRLFEASDRAGSLPVAVVSRTMAERFWPEQDAVGKRFLLTGNLAATLPPDDAGAWIEVVGVVGEARRHSLEQQPIPQVYRPHTQDPSRLMTLLVKAHGSPSALTRSIRARVAEVDPSVPLYHATTLKQQLSEQLAGRRFQTALIVLFSVLALALAATGIYGVMHRSVSERTHEIGVRMALGASQGAVLRMVLGQGLALALVGMGIGTLGAVFLGGAIRALLFEVSAGDPATLVAGALALLGVATAACYLPARRATRVDPLTALRNE